MEKIFRIKVYECLVIIIIIIIIQRMLWNLPKADKIISGTFFFHFIIFRASFSDEQWFQECCYQLSTGDELPFDDCFGLQSLSLYINTFIFLFLNI